MRILHGLGIGLLVCAASAARAQLIKPLEFYGANGVVRIGNYGDEGASSYILTTTPFTFYGTTYMGLTVSTSGVVSFGNTGYSSFNPSNLGLPRGSTPGVWAAQDDWVQTSASALTLGFIYYKSYTDGLAITWANVVHAPSLNGGATNTFQVFLYGNGDIGLGYADLNKVDSYVVGLSKGSGGEYSSLTGADSGTTAFSETGRASVSQHTYLFHYDGTHYMGSALTNVTVTGTVALDSVADLTAVNANVPIGNLTFDFFTHSAAHTTPQFSRTAPLVPVGSGSPNGTFSVSIPAGVYDIGIRAGKSLRKIVSSVNAGSNVAVPGVVTLPCGNENGDNVIDFDDFLPLLNAFGAKYPSASYDPQADFSYDGIVDFDDFLPLLNNFGLKDDP